MKPRRVIVSLELETDAPLAVLRDADAYGDPGGHLMLVFDGKCARVEYDAYIKHVQINVVKPAGSKR